MVDYTLSGSQTVPYNPFCHKVVKYGTPTPMTMNKDSTERLKFHNPIIKVSFLGLEPLSNGGSKNTCVKL